MLASVPPQVQVGEHQQTLDVIVRATGTGQVSVSLKAIGAPRARRTVHAADTVVGILDAVAGIAREVTPQLERQHRAEMRARGYKLP